MAARSLGLPFNLSAFCCLPWWWRSCGSFRRRGGAPVRRFFDPGGRPGPGLPGSWRTGRAGGLSRGGSGIPGGPGRVSRPGAQGRSQGRRRSAARYRASRNWAWLAMMSQVQRSAAAVADLRGGPAEGLLCVTEVMLGDGLSDPGRDPQCPGVWRVSGRHRGSSCRTLAAPPSRSQARSSGPCSFTRPGGPRPADACYALRAPAVVPKGWQVRITPI
jgi:hypothetical protein